MRGKIYATWFFAHSNLNFMIFFDVQDDIKTQFENIKDYLFFNIYDIIWCMCALIQSAVKDL